MIKLGNGCFFPVHDQFSGTPTAWPWRFATWDNHVPPVFYPMTICLTCGSIPTTPLKPIFRHVFFEVHLSSSSFIFSYLFIFSYFLMIFIVGVSLLHQGNGNMNMNFLDPQGQGRHGNLRQDVFAVRRYGFKVTSQTKYSGWWLGTCLYIFYFSIYWEE